MPPAIVVRVSVGTVYPSGLVSYISLIVSSEWQSLWYGTDSPPRLLAAAGSGLALSPT